MSDWSSAALLVLVAILVVATVLWCAWTATRLDRLNLRRAAAESGLRGLVQERAAVATELASTGLHDPASAVLLMDAAVAARDAADEWQAQSTLTEVIDLVDLPQDDPLVARLEALGRQVSMARRIHNDIAARAIDLRSRRRVRWFHLAGHAPGPDMIEFDDTTKG